MLSFGGSQTIAISNLPQPIFVPLGATSPLLIMPVLAKLVSKFFTKAEKNEYLKQPLRLLPCPILRIAMTIFFFYLGATIGILQSRIK